MYQGFSLKLLRLIRCPNDGGELAIEGGQDVSPVRVGMLRCRCCGSAYPIVDGILNLLSEQQSIDPVSAHEIEARNKDAENYHTYCTEIGDAKEITSTLAMMGPVAGKSVVELGCGTGRYSHKLLEQAAEFIGVDFSIDSLRLLAKTMSARDLAGLVLADASRFKTVADCFDLVFTAQLLQHLPSFSIRNDLYSNVVSQLRTGGVFVCNAYHYHLIWRLQRMPQVGSHESGIFFHRFTQRELLGEIGKHLTVRRVHPISIHVPFSRRLHFNDVWLSRKLESVPLINMLGELLLVKAEKTMPASATMDLANTPLEEV